MTALLVQATEARIQLFKSGERGKRRRDIAVQTLRQGAQVQDVAILRHRDQQRVSGAQRLGEPSLVYELAYPANLKFHRRGTVHSKLVADPNPQDPRPPRRLRASTLIAA